MKRTLLLIICILVIANGAMADLISIYSDASGNSCNLGAAGVFNADAAVIHKFANGATGSRFKAAFPAGTSFFGFNTPYVPVGALNLDLSLGYGQCLTGSIVLGNILAIYAAGSAQIVAADAFPDIIYTDCTFAELTASGGIADIGGAGNCDPHAVEPSTWGSVKSLYR